MDKFEEHGYIDTFRKLHPEEEKYSWWSYRTAARERNVGWRLDYFYISPGLANKVKKAEIFTNVTGSDHCPVLLEIDV
jgi:exodeoxyribonuclease-3